jgi:hypothetical protein
VVPSSQVSTPSSRVATLGPTAWTTPSASPAPSPVPGSWAAAALPPFEPVADLAAIRVEVGGTASVRTAFRLTSWTTTPATDLARGVEVTPAVPLAVTPGNSAATAVLTPTSPLAPATSYRFTVRGPDAALAGSWVFQTSSPPKIDHTLPDDETTDVPVDTGIEVTFDQDGVGDIAPFFSVSPKVAGRFERHGRTAVFVPAADLRPLTVYTVTIRAGVPREGSDLTLAEAVTFRFATAPRTPSATSSKAEVEIVAPGDLVEVRTAAVPVIALEASWPDSGKPASRVAVRVYRLAGLDAAIDAYSQLLAAPDWADDSDAGLVRTTGLEQVVRFDAVFHSGPETGCGWDAKGWIGFPGPLAAGWYLVDFPRRARDVQVVLQVTDVQTTTIVGSGRAVVWAHDLASGGPLGGAEVATPDGERIGRTDADGLMLAPVPARLLAADLLADPRAGLLVVRAAGGPGGSAAVPGRAALVSVAWSQEIPPEERLWHLLYTDRSLFRQDDTIEAWGLIMPRDGGPPPGAELRLIPADYWWDESDEEDGSSAAVVRAAVEPDSRSGVFATPVALHGVPIGDYTLELWVGDEQIAATWVTVGVIRKPAYRVDVSTDRRVLVGDAPIVATVRATFFDGTPAPGIGIDAGIGWEPWMGPADLDTTGSGTTGGDGTAAITLRAGDPGDQWGWDTVVAWPSGPEEGGIVGATSVLRFVSSVVLDGEASVTGGSVRVRGTLHAVDLARLEREQSEGFEGELQPQGAPVAGATVTVKVEEGWEAPIPTGRVYDFISKRSVETYDYEWRSKDLGVRRARTDAGGRFSLALPAPATGHEYTITLIAADRAGRKTSLELWASAEDQRRTSTDLVPSPELQLDRGAYAVGGSIRASVRMPAGTLLPTDARHRYLFFTARPGLLEAHVQASPRFVATYGEADVPSLTIGAAWFDGSLGGLAGMVGATIDPSSRALTVSLSSDAARYAPGGTVTLQVRTTDAAGQPAPASVVLRAIDEKLYAMGAAEAGDAAGDLYSPPEEDGIASLGSSHPVPDYGSPYRCATTGGGGPGDSSREDFRDTLLFRRVTTGADGLATVTFGLSDDLTSWRVSATAISDRLEVGLATLGIPVGLPLFVEAPLAPDYLVGERPVLRVRAYGEALHAGDPVTFTVAAPSLGLPETSTKGTAFSAVDFPLPALTAGDHAITIGAASGTGQAAVEDRLVRTIHVGGSRFSRRATAYADLANGVPRAGGEGLVTYVFADTGRARFAEPLESLVAGSGARVDQALAAVMARDLLVTAFGVDPDRYRVPDFDPGPYQVEADGDYAEGIGLLPYASADLALSARVALLAGDRFNRDYLGKYFEVRREPSDQTREVRNLALAGLAGLGTPVLGEIRAALAEPDLTIREQLYLALGAAALGDDATALAVERDLLGRYGQQLGPWLRLRVGTSLDDTIEATALAALIAATVGDPVGEAAEAYVEANPAVDDLFNLQEVGYISRMVDRTPSGPARLAYSIRGEERTANIEAGGAFSLTLVPSQAAALTARTLTGRIGVAVSWDDPVDPATLARDPSFTLTRSVSPSGVIPSDGLVKVTLRATFGPQAVDGCYLATDVLPSGLAPLDESGQRVAFCLGPWKDRSGISGQFEGIGIQIATQAADGAQGCQTLGPGCHLLIAGVMAGSPAERAGLTAGDLVLEVDGVALDELTMDAALDMISGPKGTVVTLTIWRGSADFQLEITRDVVGQKEVDGKVLADSVTYRARVVSPGIYRWEPAVLQLAGSSESLALTPPAEVTIR